MEKKLNYSVTSDPKVNNSDGDKLTDFEEFMNGSDPRSLDTDGDGIDDTNETLLKSNITGIEGTPPEIKDVKLTVEVHKHEEQLCDPWGHCSPPFRVPDGLRPPMSFNVTAARGHLAANVFAMSLKPRDYMRRAKMGCRVLRPTSEGCRGVRPMDA